jgi:hypothetical protein
MSDLRVYFGEFMRQFYALELSGNFCSHACAYCYANLNKPDRAANPTATLNALKTAQDRQHKDLLARLIVEKYPVVMSNHIDPFSNSNWRIYRTYIDIFRDMKIPLFQSHIGAIRIGIGKSPNTNVFVFQSHIGAIRILTRHAHDTMRQQFQSHIGAIRI